MKSKTSTKKKLLHFLAPHIIRMIISTFGITYKQEWQGREHLDQLKANGKNWILSTWHNNILGDSLLLRDQNLVSMVSTSTDGMIAAKVLELMGNQTIRGSTSRGGVKVLLRMIKEIKSGLNGAITPDGPRGPRFVLKEGAISIAQKTGAALVPLHYESTNQWTFEKSWDQQKLPKPFSTLIISIGEPFFVPEKLSRDEFEAVRQEFENRMMDNTRETIQAAKQKKDQ